MRGLPLPAVLVLGPLTVVAALASGIGTHGNGNQVASGTGAVIQPGQGDRLFLCDAPELSMTIKVDSVTVGATHMAMGTAQLDGANAGVHRDEDEVIFIYRGSGRVIVGDDTASAEPGTTMYVPRGVRHGFISDADAPMEFAWVVVPQGLEKSFRAIAVRSLEHCNSSSADEGR
jgi:mannose-6-phosphate isomerase-like protein (cupin superfamily)